MNEEKFCPSCETIKPLTAFHKRQKAKDGRSARCGECINTGIRVDRVEGQVLAKGEKVKNIPKGKLFCKRGEGKVMARSKCLRGCNDACFTCKHRNDDTLAIASEGISPEEEREERYAIQSISGRCVSARDSATRPYFRGD